MFREEIGDVQLGARKRSRRQHRPSLVVEALEGRLCPAKFNYLVLDYTTPAKTLRLDDGSFVRGASFDTIFTARYSWLDFNSDKVVNGKDAGIARQQMKQRLAKFFDGIPNRPVIQSGGLGDTASFDLGQSKLRISRGSFGQLTDVIYVGGRTFLHDKRIWGVAFQAPEVSNYEHYGFVFAENDAAFVNSKKVPARAKRTDFINSVAKAIAHEYGHLMGLGHVKGNSPFDSNVMNYNAAPSKANFPNVPYSQIHLQRFANGAIESFCGPQNPYQELTNSFGTAQRDHAVQTLYSRAVGNSACGIRLPISARANGNAAPRTLAIGKGSPEITAALSNAVFGQEVSASWVHGVYFS